MSTAVSIDASQGEGGGQIVRSAVALSMFTGRAVRLWNIRARRAKPGLQRQHVTAVQAAAQVADAQLRGVEIGSRELLFEPGTVRPGEYRFDIGSAGSTTLVLQTILPPLLSAEGPSTIVLHGGTHNPLAPPVDFFARSFAPLLRQMGPQLSVRLDRYGFYPLGGGQVTVQIEPAPRLQPLRLVARGAVRSRRATAIVSRLPRHIAERELSLVADRLGWHGDELQVVEVASAKGPGNVLLLEVCCEHVTEIVTGFGQKGVRAEAVAEAAVAEVQRYLDANVPVGERLADQLLLPLALARGGEFVTLPLSSHTLTNMTVIQQFLPVEFRCRVADDGKMLILVAWAGCASR